MNIPYNEIVQHLDPSIKMLLDKVKRYLSVGKVSVMVGCGFSLNAESDGTGVLKDWNSLSSDLFYSLYGRTPSDEENAKLNPIRLASQVEAVHGEKELNEIIYNALPDNNVFPGSLHEKLMKLHWRDVFTTNYDTLLERGSEKVGTAYTVVTTKETLLYSKSPRIIKLHGSFPDVRPFIMSEESFRTYPTKYPEFVNTVRQSLIENLFCLIGFSGNDPNFLSWLGWIRDVMGDLMTNAILVCHNKNKTHVSERKLFEDRKIDILNLAEIPDLTEYHDALDFFLTYIGEKDVKQNWHYNIGRVNRFEKRDDSYDYTEDIRQMTESRQSYLGWVYMPEGEVRTCGVCFYPNWEHYFNDLPQELRISFLYELDWLLDKCLFPKYAEWYIKSIEQVMANYSILSGENKSKANQLIISLCSSYRELRQLDNYLRVLDFINDNLLANLNQTQLSTIFYEQCLWNLSILDYKATYETLLKWNLVDNDYVGALWKSSIFRELGDIVKSDDILIQYYSRLITKMLQNEDNQFYSTCIHLYSYVMTRTLSKDRKNIEFVKDQSVANLNKMFLAEATKGQPDTTTSHGFSLNDEKTTSHLYNGGYYDNYLYANRYLRMSHLHGNIYQRSCINNEYREIITFYSRYRFYSSISYLVRTGNRSLVEAVVNRENLSEVASDDIYLIFLDLFEMMKTCDYEGGLKMMDLKHNVILPILLRLCTKASDDNLNDLFDYIISQKNDCRIDRNDVLKTIYENATYNQLNEMFAEVMSRPISLNSNQTDILWPNIEAECEISDLMIENAISQFNCQEYVDCCYRRVVALLEAKKISAHHKKKLEKAVINWRTKETKSINVVYSFNVIPATSKETSVVKKWTEECKSQLIDKTFNISTNSQEITDFIFNLQNLIPAVQFFSSTEKDTIISVIIKTLENNRNQIVKEEEEENKQFLSFRKLYNGVFNAIEEFLIHIDWKDISEDNKQRLLHLIQEFASASYPNLLLSAMVNIEDKKTIASKAYSKLFSKTKALRTDAIRALFLLFKTYPTDFTDDEKTKLIERMKYYLEFSHSKNIKEYIGYITALASEELISKKDLKLFNSTMDTIYEEIEDYDIPYEYKIDIIQKACEFEGLMSVILGTNSIVDKWHKISEHKEHFRDVKNGFFRGTIMLK